MFARIYIYIYSIYRIYIVYIVYIVYIYIVYIVYIEYIEYIEYIVYIVYIVYIYSIYSLCSLCLRPENRPSVFAFFCVVICLGGGVGGCNNVLFVHSHRSSSVITLHATFDTSVLLR